MRISEKRVSSTLAMVVAVICVFFAMSGLAGGAAEEGTIRDQKLVIEKGRKTLGAASLEYREGIPFLTLYFTKTPSKSIQVAIAFLQVQ